MVDEAHKLAPPVLEEIRLLSNFELADAKLLQIVMAGQNELSTVLNREDLRQLKQRVSVRLTLPALSRIDVEHYIQHRWTKAGGATPHPFSAGAMGQIAHWSNGIPRLINVLCDNALVLAFGEGTKAVTAEHVAEVASDLDLREPMRWRPPLALRTAGAPHATANGHPAMGPNIESYAPNSSKPSRLSRLVAKLHLGEARES